MLLILFDAMRVERHEESEPRVKVDSSSAAQDAMKVEQVG
jgi:hypothetical protein